MTDFSDTPFIERGSFFWTPDYIDISAWIEHVPFAFWITEVAKPKVIVELGVHKGTSYFAFCQAIKQLNLNSTAYGVDTWRGDEHAGFYSDEIFNKVSGWNNQHFSKFSTLIRSTFDEAKEFFLDGTIELLHIDGFHTYEAVKHDFESWLPKMAKNGIVLFHDINVRKADFGVFRFWDELKKKYSNFQFDFGHGLGVLCLGEAPQNELKSLFSGDPDNQLFKFLKNLFFDRGNNFKIQLDNSQQRVDGHEIEQLRKQNDELKEIYNNLIEKSKSLEKYSKKSLNDASSHLSEFSNEIDRIKRENEVLKEHINWYKHTYEERSLAGVIKEKTLRGLKRSVIKMINKLLKKEKIKNRYAVAYILEYVRDNGVKYAFKRAWVLFKEDGFKQFSRQTLRKKAVKKLSKKGFRPLPVKEEINVEQIKESIKTFTYQPKISLIFPTYNTKPELLLLAIKSISNQLYENWELCIIDDCSTNTHTLDVLKAYQNESKIKIGFLHKNSGISEASNAAIQLTTGDFIALMDHDDEITPDALYHVVKLLNEHIDADIIYSDECKVDEQGVLSDYFFKPKWSPELLINMMYLGHLTVYRKQFLLDKVGLFRKQFDFSQDYDLALRATEKTNNIYHIDKVIYHWRITEGSSSQGDKPYARTSNLAALSESAQRKQINGEVVELPVANRLKITVPAERKVSIIIPTDSYDNLKETIESILRTTSFTNFEIIPVTNSALISKMQEDISSSKVSFVPYDKPYNFSDKCNVGATLAAGDILIFFNDDVRPLEKDWIENLIEFLEIPEVGGVSPKLIYEDDTIQYAGMATGVRNLTGTTFHTLHKSSHYYLNFPQLVRNVSILSGACLAIKKDLFEKVNGFDSINTPIGHSDVDLSFKILDAGFRCVYTPYATLRHIGHLSLGAFENNEKKSQKKLKKDKADIFLIKRWGRYLNDPYFPTPLKNHVYQDSPEPYHVYAPQTLNFNNKQGNNKDILLVCHELSYSGAPLMLYSTAKILQELGYYVVVTAPNYGPLQKLYEQIGITVIIDELVLSQHASFERFAKNFDFIICNTIVAWPVVKQMQNITRTLWWIHEGKVVLPYFEDTEFVTTLRNAKHIVGVSDYSISFIKKYNPNISKIYNYFDDRKTPASKNATGSNKIIFSLIGSIEQRKGQLLLVNALKKINPELLANIEIWIIGRVLHRDYYLELVQESKKLPSIKIIGEKTHAECIQLMQQSAVILNTSVDDPFPLSLVEALAMSKPCIVSSHTGLAELMDNEVNGFIFESGNAFDLSQKIQSVISNNSILETIGKKGREIFDKHLSREKAVQNWKKYIEYLEFEEIDNATAQNRLSAVN